MRNEVILKNKAVISNTAVSPSYIVHRNSYISPPDKMTEKNRRNSL